jgi:radical SAM superfamily enzyme YgiQ (UPF0313 family)
MKHIVIYLISEWDFPLSTVGKDRNYLAKTSLDLLPHEKATTSELTTMPPYGATLAGNVLRDLKRDDFIGLLDEYMLQIPILEKIELLINQYPVEEFTLYFSVYVFNNDRTANVINELKQKFNNIKIVVGGAFAEHFTNNKNIDAVIIGDAETGLAEYFEHNNRITYAPKADQNQVLVDFSIINNDILYNHGVINSMRGCKFRVNESRTCVFCSMPETSLRLRKPDVILLEMAKEANTLGTEWFFDGSDSFVISKKWLKEFSNTRKKLIETGYTILKELKIFTYVNPSDVKDAEIPNLLFECGTRKVFFGIESGDDTILKNMNKPKATVKSNLNALKLFVGSNIEIRFGIVLGIGETEETLLNTYNFLKELNTIKDLNIVSVVLSVVIVLPGSVLYNNMLAETNRFSQEYKQKITEIDTKLKNGNGITKYEIDVLSRIYLQSYNHVSFDRIFEWKQKMEDLLIDRDIDLWTFGGYRKK